MHSRPIIEVQHLQEALLLQEPVQVIHPPAGAAALTHVRAARLEAVTADRAAAQVALTAHRAVAAQVAHTVHLAAAAVLTAHRVVAAVLTAHRAAAAVPTAHRAEVLEAAAGPVHPAGPQDPEGNKLSHQRLNKSSPIFFL